MVNVVLISRCNSSVLMLDNESLMVRGAADGIYIKYKLNNPCVAGPYIINFCAARTVYN